MKCGAGKVVLFATPQKQAFPASHFINKRLTQCSYLGEIN